MSAPKAANCLAFIVIIILHSFDCALLYKLQEGSCMCILKNKSSYLLPFISATAIQHFFALPWSTPNKGGVE